MAAKVILLGVCAASRDLLLEWSEAGLLPNYRAAMERGLTGFIDSMPGFYVGTTWPSFATCVSPARHSRHYIEQLVPGTYEFRRFPKGLGIRCPPFWATLSKAGRRVSILDVPHTKPIADLNGVQVVEWGAHDGDFAELITSPVEVAAEIISKFGPHPAPRSCDGTKTTAEFAVFRDRLVEGARLRAEITRHFMERDNWDFLAQVWTESHCAGHQCWHFHDSTHPRHDAEAAAVVGDPVRDVYVAIDAALGRVLEAVDGDTTVILFTGHGMGCKYDAQFFLNDILLRLGHAVPFRGDEARKTSDSVSRHRRLDGLLTSGWQHMPPALKQLAQPLRQVLRGWVEESRPQELPDIDPAASRCFPVRNNAVHGGIRINLAGREPEGKVHPGAEYDALCARIVADLMVIINLDTGEPVAERVFRTDSAYSGECMQYLPDILIEWRQSSPVFAIGSDRIGRLQGIDPYTRTGDHRKGGLFIAFGPGIRPGKLDRAVQVTDFGPTIAAMLNVDLGDIDGSPIREISDAPQKAALAV